jgi:PIN domain nuclease of toxin-antitoxin system
LKLLLDTHVLAFWFLDKSALPLQVQFALESMDNEIWVSSASAYEMAFKHKIGKWPEISPLANNFETLVTDQGFGITGISVAHALLAGSMSSLHRDPFDRILTAQAILEQMLLVTGDSMIKKMSAPTLW